MTETAGSCGTVIANRSNVTQSVFAPKTNRNTFLDDLKDAYKNYQANKDAKEYERIMNKPTEERTFSEKCFVAQMQLANVVDKIDKMKPPVMYMA